MVVHTSTVVATTVTRDARWNYPSNICQSPLMIPTFVSLLISLCFQTYYLLRKYKGQSKFESTPIPIKATSHRSVIFTSLAYSHTIRSLHALSKKLSLLMLLQLGHFLHIWLQLPWQELLAKTTRQSPLIPTFSSHMISLCFQTYY